MYYRMVPEKLFTLAIVQVALFSVLTLTAAALQETTTSTGVQPDAIQCWWRTSNGAIRVGELFDVVLTCSLMDTPASKAVVDESALDPNAIQIEPFEVDGGNRSADIPSPNHQFFQYVYHLRLTSPDFFAKDVKLPEKKITYRIQRRSGNGPAVEGIEQTYALPNLSLHVLSLVPADANDIRDAPSVTFAEIDSRQFRATILKLLAVVLGIAASLLLVLAAARFVRSRRPDRTLRQLVPDLAVLDTVLQELDAIAHQRRRSEPTSGLGARLLTALRVLSAYAVDGAKVPLLESKDRVPQQGYLRVQYRRNYPINPFAPRVQALVPASITPYTIAASRARLSPSDAQRAEMLEELERGISRLTAGQYSRADTTGNEDFDSSLEAGIRAARRLRHERHWLTREMKRIRTALSVIGRK